jgi:Spy/CpxP family protein refolding chaperone
MQIIKRLKSSIKMLPVSKFAGSILFLCNENLINSGGQWFGGANMILETSKRRWYSGILSFSAFALLTICFIPSFNYAGIPDSNDGKIQHQTRQPQPKLGLDSRVRQFAKALDLNAEQQAAVRKILLQQQQEILEIRHDPTLVGSAGIDKVRALQEITAAKIRAILNEEQKKKYDPFAPRRIPPSTQYSVEDWLNATTPSDKGHK